MVMSVIPMRWITSACWLGRGKSSNADCAWQSVASRNRQGMADSLNRCICSSALADVLEVPQSNHRIRVSGSPQKHLRTVGRGPDEAVSAKGRVARTRLRSTSERDETKRLSCKNDV